MMSKDKMLLAAEISKEKYFKIQRILLDLNEHGEKTSVAELIRKFFDEWLEEYETRQHAKTKAAP